MLVNTVLLLIEEKLFHLIAIYCSSVISQHVVCFSFHTVIMDLFSMIEDGTLLVPSVCQYSAYS